MRLRDFEAIKSGAFDQSHVAGLTHCFYRYPARFSPAFVGKAIEAFSAPGDVILDPFVGGGTTLVEAMARGRIGVGSDLNELAIFVSSAKTTILTSLEQTAVTAWIHTVTPKLSYRAVLPLTLQQDHAQTRNLTLARARPIKKVLAYALASITDLPTPSSQRFARCVLLNVSQWALHNRKHSPSLQCFRERLTDTCDDMLAGMRELERRSLGPRLAAKQVLHHGSAKQLGGLAPFAEGLRATLVVTSPPYPGIHVLYHRWQVDGRKETGAPYWIAGCLDGQGESYYNFGARRRDALRTYFVHAKESMGATRACMRRGATIVQLIAFSEPDTQLRRYLRMMAEAGFAEVRGVDSGRRAARFRRLRRTVPSRAWHASQKGSTGSSREVVLIHRAD